MESVVRLQSFNKLCKTHTDSHILQKIKKINQSSWKDNQVYFININTKKNHKIKQKQNFLLIIVKQSM